MLGGLAASAMLFFRLRDVPNRTEASKTGLPWREALRTMRPLLMPLVGIIATRVFLLSALQTYLPTFLSEEGAGLWVAGASLTVFEAAGVGGALLGGSISDLVGRRSVLFAAGAAAAGALGIGLARRMARTRASVFVGSENRS